MTSRFQCRIFSHILSTRGREGLMAYQTLSAVVSHCSVSWPMRRKAYFIFVPAHLKHMLPSVQDTLPPAFLAITHDTVPRSGQLKSGAPVFGLYHEDANTRGGRLRMVYPQYLSPWGAAQSLSTSRLSVFTSSYISSGEITD